MTSYVTVYLRQLVEDRANRLCEYCLIAEGDSYLGCQVDHVISEKHGGATNDGNLAYSCTCCNRAKGTDVGSIVENTGEFVRFFNPRTDRWADHFELHGTLIAALTVIGDVTARMLQFNSRNRVLERSVLIGIGRYPPKSVATRG